MLGSLLASTDMSNHPVDTLMATLRHCAKFHTVASLLTETSGAVLQAIGVSAGELTFKSYLDHMVPPSTSHGVTPTIGERITALCAINVNGVAIARKAAGAEACADIKDELEVARYCNTCPLWLDQAGNELWPKVLGHETMLKPADCWKVEDRGDDGKRCRGVSLTDQEAALHFPHVPDVSELSGHAVYSADLSLPYPTTRRRAELCLQHLELGHVLERELDLDHLIDSVHNEPDALVHVVGREVVDELQVLDVTSCQVAQRACQLGLLRDQLTPLGYPRLVLVLDLEVGAEHLEELIEGR